MLSQAFFSSQRMVYLIADLLNVSRLRTGKFIIEVAPVNLAQMISEEVEQLTEIAKARSQTLTYKAPKHFPDLMLDDVKTRQVIMNFVDNALHYTPSGGKINVRLIETPTTVEMRVEDNGLGVPKSEQPHLFTKFYRAANARNVRPDGTGLGLFMAKKVVVAQGGSVIFESQENKGSTFGFIFSKSKTGVAPAKPTPKPAPPKKTK
jgi:signal transduction histidine kinase